jgi:hypothetical protein
VRWSSVDTETWTFIRNIVLGDWVRFIVVKITFTDGYLSRVFIDSTQIPPNSPINIEARVDCSIGSDLGEKCIDLALDMVEDVVKRYGADVVKVKAETLQA